jgi:thioredoxin reductase (NADPH)
MRKSVDCLIIGGGPAGLTAAIYAARFHLSVLLVDAGRSRAAMIPCTHNHAGFPEGISGLDLLQRMRRQAMHYGAEFVIGHVRELHPISEGFLARTERDELRGRTVLLATGVTNRRPTMDESLHAEALKRGRLRYCPVCDGYEVTGQKIAVIGAGGHAVNEAEFLRSYSADISVIATDAEVGFDEAQRAHLGQIGVHVFAGPAHDFVLEPTAISLACGDGRLSFDTIYPALGSIVHSDLAEALGAQLTETGCVKTDAHQRASVPGLYAAGDVVIGLDQISHAMGEAGVAATTIRNDLAAQSPLLW